MSPLVSIIIPMYNVERYLKKCVDSVTGQSYKNLEIILINDGSTDKTYMLAQELAQHDERIILIDKRNGGLSSARNKGLEAAKGEFVLFVDSDDWIDSTFVEKTVEVAKEYNADIVATKFWSNSRDRKQVTSVNYDIFEDNCAEALFSCKDSNYAWAKLIKRKLFVMKGISFPEGRHYEDIGTMYKIYDNASCSVSLDNELYYYSVRQGSITTQRKPEDVEDKIFFLNEMVNYKLSRDYIYWGNYLLVKSFGAMADVFKCGTLTPDMEKKFIKTIYGIVDTVPLCSRLKWPYVKQILIRFHLAHIMLGIKYFNRGINH